MTINDFLAEDDHYKYLLLQFLDLRKNTFLTIGMLCENFGLSKFKIRRYLEELNDDLHQFNQHSRIFLQRDGEIETEQLTFLLVKKMRLFYAKRSQLYLLLQGVFEKNMTIGKYGEENFLSKSKAYELKKQLVHIVREEGLSYKKNRLIGDEQHVRNYIFGIYYEFYNGLETPFSLEICQQIHFIYNLFQYYYQLQFSYTKQKKVEFFLGIMIIRIKNQEFITTNLFEPVRELRLDEKDLLNSFIHFFEDIPDRKKKNLQLEFYYVLLFLFCEGHLDSRELPYRLKMNQRCKETLEKNVATILEQITISGETNPVSLKEIEQQLLEELQKIHWKLDNFYSSVDTFSSIEQLQFFQESQPKLAQLVEYAIKQLLNLGLLDERLKMRAYYDYLFTILACVPSALLEKKVYICVDFSHGEAYTNYVMDQIKGFHNLNLAISDKFTPKTQLYLSDFASEKLTCKQIIWKNPPTAEDWEEFGDEIVRLKNEGGHYE